MQMKDMGEGEAIGCVLGRNVQEKGRAKIDCDLENSILNEM